MKLDCKPTVNGPGWIFIDSTGKPWNGGFWGGVNDHTPGGRTNVLMGDGSTDTVVVWRQAVKVVKGGIYEFSVWFINANVNGKYNGATSFFEIRTDSANGPVILSTGRIGRLDPWTKYTGTYTAPISDTVGFYIVNFAVESGGNDFGIDDVRLRCINVPEPCVKSSYSNYSICQNDSLSLHLDSSSNYSWNTTQWMNDSNNTSPVIIPDSSLLYICNYQDTADCEHTDSFEVVVHPNPEIVIQSQVTSICLGDTIRLIATGADSFQWINKKYIDRSDTDAVFVFPDIKTVFNVIGINETGCNGSDSIAVMPENCQCEIYIPNAITVNHDQLNEGFKPIPNCNITSYSMSIFNRWGMKIFQTNDINQAWDGTYRQLEVSMGIYIYLFDYTYGTPDKERTEFRSGIIHVLR